MPPLGFLKIGEKYFSQFGPAVRPIIYMSKKIELKKQID